MAKTPTEIRSLARSHTEAAINVLAGIMNKTDAPESARVAAAEKLLDRGWGKAVQPMAVTVEDPWQTMLAGVVAEVSEDEAIARAHDYSAREGATSVED